MELSEKIFRPIVNMAAHVMRSYRFTDFDHVEIVDQAGSRSIKVSKDDLEKLRTKKLKYENIVK